MAGAAPALLQRIVVQSDGVPLSIEELTKAVIETAAQNAPGTASTIAVPANLQASLLSRLDRMPAANRSRRSVQCSEVTSRTP